MERSRKMTIYPKKGNPIVYQNKESLVLLHRLVKIKKIIIFQWCLQTARSSNIMRDRKQSTKCKDMFMLGGTLQASGRLGLLHRIMSLFAWTVYNYGARRARFWRLLLSVATIGTGAQRGGRCASRLDVHGLN